MQSSAIVIPIGTLVADPEKADIRDKDELPLPFHEKTKESNGGAITAGIIGGLLLLAVHWDTWACGDGWHGARSLRRVLSGG